MSGRRFIPSFLARIGPVALLALLAGLLLGPALWGDQALLPGAALQGMAPWSGAAPRGPNEPPWNPLLWDALAQFYPWRLFAARWIRQGVFPLWDPHQFCGTPFLANSQSALLYPLNWLIFLPLGLSVTRAMALVAWLHLTLAGGLTYLWLRGLGAARPAAFTAGAAFMLSGFCVAWLELPTLLSVACWLPLLFLAVHRLVSSPTVVGALGLGVVIALTLLGGHLQIAFYCLVGATIYALGELVRLRPRVWPRLGAALLAGALGLLLASPQLLPAIELSRMSHRVGTPSAAGFAAYVAYAMPIGNLITLFLPDFYGNPSRGDYWGVGNYAEYAAYVGVVALYLALIALLRARRLPQTWILALLALFGLLMATGSRLNALFYFGVPGFGQSGSPGRILVLFCFAAASLAGLGLDALLAGVQGGTGEGEALTPQPQGSGGTPTSRPQGCDGALTPQPPLPIMGEGEREDRTGGRWAPMLPALAAVALWVILFVAARAAAAGFVAGTSIPFSLAWSRSESAFFASVALVGIAVGALVAPSILTRLRLFPGAGGWAVGLVVPALIVLDGWNFAWGYNPVTPIHTIYPSTAAIRLLRTRQAAEPGARILPLNRRWSLTAHPRAVLPPNAALALGLHDAQGYDSLFLGRYKGFANAIQAPRDSSPVQNGNMIFLSNLASPLLPLLSARSIVTVEPILGRSPLWTGERVWIYDNPDALPRAFLVSAVETAPTEEAELEALTRLAGRGVRALRQTVVVPESTSPPGPLPEAGRGGWNSVNSSPLPVSGRGDRGERSDTRTDLASRIVSPGGARERDKPPGDATYIPVNPNVAEVRVRARGPAWLVVTDTYAPGWRVYEVGADGREKPLRLVRGDFNFRAVAVPAGERIVRFRYQPARFRLGLYLAAVGLLVLAGWGGVVVRSRSGMRSRHS